MAFTFGCRASFGSTWAATHGFVHIAVHIRPIIVSSHGGLDTTMSRVTGKERRM